MGRRRNHLTRWEREFLYKSRRKGKSFGWISKQLGRPKGTLCKEMKRNRDLSLAAASRTASEDAGAAHSKALKRRHCKKVRFRLKNLTIRTFVKQKIESKWCPEIIAARLPLEHPGMKVCVQSIYDWVYEEVPELKKYLKYVSKRGNRKRRASRKYGTQAPAAPKVSIEQRPAVVGKRKRFGDLEVDTFVSNREGKGAMLNATDRAFRLVILHPLMKCCAETASSALILRLKRLKPWLKSFTMDNGPENAEHALITEKLGVPVFFCHPYSASERGTVENRNGKARETFPKGTDFSKVTLMEALQEQDRINFTPMVVLKGLTPLEAFAKAVGISLEEAWILTYPEQITPPVHLLKERLAA